MTEAVGMSETEQVLPQPRDIDYDTFYEPVKEAGGFHTDEGRGVQEGLETNDATMAALQEIGVADGLIEYAAARWPYSHGGSEMDKEGVRFGILRRRSEDHTRKFTTPPSRTWKITKTDAILLSKQIKNSINISKTFNMHITYPLLEVVVKFC